MNQAWSRRAASEAVAGQGWRFLLGTLRTTVPVVSLAQAAEVAARAVAACGDDADGHLCADLRPERVVLTLRSAGPAGVTGRDVDLAHRISAAVPPTEPGPVQLLEIAVDALDIPAVRPFWRAGRRGQRGVRDHVAGPRPCIAGREGLRAEQRRKVCARRCVYGGRTLSDAGEPRGTDRAARGQRAAWSIQRATRSAKRSAEKAPACSRMRLGDSSPSRWTAAA